jgi:hypothetical protein
VLICTNYGMKRLAILAVAAAALGTAIVACGTNDASKSSIAVAVTTTGLVSTSATTVVAAAPTPAITLHPVVTARSLAPTVRSSTTVAVATTVTLPPTMTLTGQDGGRTIHIRVGAVIDVSLDYHWYPPWTTNASVLQRVDSRTNRDGTVAGRFKAVTIGNADVDSLTHCPDQSTPCGGGAPANFSVHIVVGP